MPAQDIEMASVATMGRPESEAGPTPASVQRSWSMGSYPKLSEFMGSWSDIAIFRRFSTLNAENLLFLQAELSHLEHALREIRKDEALSEDNKKQKALRSWWDLKGDEDNEQLDLIHDIRARLKEYNDFLLQYKELSKIHAPSKHDLRCLRDWLERPKCGDNFLEGVEREVWDAQRGNGPSDLITMSESHVDRDLFTKWLSEDLVPNWFHRLLLHKIKRPYDIETGVYHYKESSLKAVAHILGVLFASTIPAASIFTLYYVHDMVARLGAIFAFSALFSICLAVFTTARRVEIFGATAAYAFVFALAAVLSQP